MKKFAPPLEMEGLLLYNIGIKIRQESLWKRKNMFC